MRGFTLLETVLYIALFGLVMGGAFTGIFAISESMARNQALAYLQYEGMFLLSSMSYSVQNADVVSTPMPGYTSSILSLTSQTGQTSFTISDGALEETSATSQPLALSGNNFTISSLVFDRSNQLSSTTINDTDLIRVSLTLSTHTEQGQVVSESFSDTFTPSL